MDSTLPALHLFHRESGVMRQDLRDLMIAWTVARSDEALGYVSTLELFTSLFGNTLSLTQIFAHQDRWGS